MRPIETTEIWFWTSNNTKNKVKKNPDWEKIFAKLDTNSLYPDHIKKFYNSILRG